MKRLAILLLLVATGVAGCRTSTQPSDADRENARPSDSDKTIVMGRVTDIGGNPIAGAKLSIMLVNMENAPQDYRAYFAGNSDKKDARSDKKEIESNSQGRFALDTQLGGNLLSVYADGYAAMFRIHVVTKGVNRGWDFALPKSAHVSGRILDTKGNPMPHRVLDLFMAKREPPPAPDVGFYARVMRDNDISNENGIFDMPNVSPGKYAVTVIGPYPFAGGAMVQAPVKGQWLDVKSGDRVKNFEIRVNPPADYAISGHVRDTSGNPVRGLTAMVSLENGGLVSSNDGAFRIEGLDGMGLSSFTVSFGDNSGGTVVIPDVPLNATNVDLIWPDKGSLHGVVRNAKAGAAVTAYQVTVPLVKLSSPPGAIWEKPNVTTKINPDSSFNLSDVPAGEAVIEVRAEGLGAQRFTTLIEAGKDSELACEMLGWAILEAHTTLNGKPTSAYVILNDEWLYTDHAGKVRSGKHPNGNYTVGLFDNEYSHRSAEVQLKSGETTRLDMEIGGSCSVRGSVIFPKNDAYCDVRLASKPAPNGWIGWRPKADEYVLAMNRVPQSGGEYHLRNIPPGRYYLMAGRCRPSTYRSGLVFSKAIEVKEGEVLSLDLDLTETEEQSESARPADSDKTIVMGRVTDIAGNPIAGAKLSINNSDYSEDDPLRYSEEIHSDQKGRFSLDTLPGNKSSLLVYANGYAAMRRTHVVAKGVNRGWDFVLPLGAHVSGRVLNTKGTPAPQRLLELRAVNGGPPPAPGVSFANKIQGGLTTDEKGVFDMRNISPGKYSISVYGSSPVASLCMQQEPVSGKFLEVKSGERIEGFEIRVNPPEEYVISGHVKDARGNPVPSVVVSTQIPRNSASWWTQTDENGAFCIKGLDGMSLSSFRVNFDVPRAGVYKVAIPDVPMNTKAVDFIVPDKGIIHGTVRNAKTGEKVSTYEVTVPVVNLPESKAVWEEPPVKIERNPDASFSISNVPAGQATIEIRAKGLGPQRFAVQVEADKTNQLQCEMLGPAEIF